MQSENVKQSTLPFTKILGERAEEMVDLNLTNEQTKAILATASDSFWIVNGLTRKFVQANSSYCIGLGYSVEELSEMTLDDIDAALTEEEKNGIMAKIFQTGGARFETKHRHKNGSLLDIEISVTFDKTALQLYCFGRDISERKRIEEKLKESLAISRSNSERFEALFDNSGDAIFIIDLNGKVLDANQRACVRYGYSREDFMQKRIRDVSFDTTDDEVNARLIAERVSRVLAGELIIFESIHVTSNGERFPVEIASRQVILGDEKILLSTARDISERKQIEQKLKESYTMLSAAKEEADAANRAKSEFLANMSHEIRTPMNAIIGMSHLALRTQLTPPQRDYLKKIHTSGNNLLTIINNILDISKIESGKMTLDDAAFVLDDVMENVVDLVAEKAATKNLELTFDIEKNVPQNLVGDSLRLGQILLNYAYNAVKFTIQGEIRFVVRVKEQTDRDVMLYFAVRDTGIGLSEAQKITLFQNFIQADASITRKYGGTGLGLAISRQFSELMGGEVGVESELGKGSTFWFTARLGIGSDTRHELVPVEELRGRRVLIVDDSVAARQICSEMLTSMSFVVGEAHSGQAALDALLAAEGQGRPFEIVFLDWRMAEMDGIETFRRMKVLGLSVMPHVILLTAYGREWVVNAAQEAGIECVLVKPVSSSCLFNAIVQVLGGHDNVTTHSGEELPSAGDEDLSAIYGADVLLVEDNDYNQDVATGLLKLAGCRIDLAENGEIAVTKVRQKQYELVLMDMQMPVMDGITATTIIRTLPLCRDLPIVAMTANAMKSDREKCILAGMNDYIAKPIDPAILWKVLLKYIHPRTTTVRVAQPQRTTETSSNILLPNGIVGLDCEAGLGRVLGNRTLYLSLLKKFMASNRDTVKNICNAMDAGDTSTAERITHTLKGVSAGLGAMPLHDISAALELSFRKKHTHDEQISILARLESVLAELLEQMKQQSVLHVEQKVSVIVDPVRLKEICHQLKTLLEDSDSESSDIMEKHADILESAFGEKYKAIKTEIGEYNFDTALEALVAAARDADITLYTRNTL